ncbi:protein CBFA2T1-like [Tubulanus polymorphus]|uniref:protein CBFA2T1-like n=1 Tax=Tubulanus polymorphus TaxID=672921 RepID=UPI003DA36CDA
MDDFENACLMRDLSPDRFTSSPIIPSVYCRDSMMPDSPDTNSAIVTSTNISPITSIPPPPPTSLTRPLSTSSAGMNGNHSPRHSPRSMNGRTPSPPSMGNTTSSQQLPPACGARQLSKLKRFLTTLMQFGSDISPEIGERVRTLVLGLVNSHLSIEEFHAKLQEATNFPLRPFVIPFLKANLPLLQRELLHCARLAKQTPQQYLAHNEHILFETTASPNEGQDLQVDVNENGKRRTPDDRKEVDTQIDTLHPAKRHHAMSPGSNGSRISPTGPINLNYGPIRLEDLSRDLRERDRLERERLERERIDRLERERHYSNNSYSSYHRDTPFDHMERMEDEWKHVDNMLNCIVNMVDKTKRALSVLQERCTRDREELAIWMRRHSDSIDHDLKKRTHGGGELISYRQTEDRVNEVKRRAEDAVNEVKRQAVSELQKAVAAAEQKANELVAAEKQKMECTIADIRKQAREDMLSAMNQQEESSETCWNCGRKASETCSGCNVARYCGSYCQHKDWENHHRVCGQPQTTRGEPSSTAPSTSSTTTTSTTKTIEASPSTPPVVSSPVHSSSGSRASTPNEVTTKIPETSVVH